MKRKRTNSTLRRWRVPFLAAIAVIAVFVGYQVVAQSSEENTGSANRTVVTLDGKTVTVPVAGKATAVYFFATTCTTCLPALRDLAYASRKHPEIVYVPVSINPYDDATKVQWFLTRAGDENRAAAIDPEGRFALAMKTATLGTLIVYDRSGSQIYRGIEPAANAMTAAFAKAVQ